MCLPIASITAISSWDFNISFIAEVNICWGDVVKELEHLKCNSLTAVDSAHDQMVSIYGFLQAEPLPKLLTMTFEANAIC